MTTSITPQTKTATQIINSALVLMPSALVLSSALSLVAPAVNAFEVERGPHGSNRIVKTNKAETAQPQVKQSTRQTEKRRSTIFTQQGSHGAHRIVTEEGVGGPGGANTYRGFPTLEGTSHEGEVWNGRGWTTNN